MLLLRKYEEHRTIGKLVYPDGSHTYCLERPWLGNKPNVSCIPEGEYIVDRDKTGRFQYYKLREVEGRSHIEIHQANHPSELAGCLSPCLDYNDTVTFSSRMACEKLILTFEDASFVLTIREWNEEDGEF